MIHYFMVGVQIFESMEMTCKDNDTIIKKAYYIIVYHFPSQFVEFCVLRSMKADSC